MSRNFSKKKSSIVITDGHNLESEGTECSMNQAAKLASLRFEDNRERVGGGKSIPFWF